MNTSRPSSGAQIKNPDEVDGDDDDEEETDDSPPEPMEPTPAIPKSVSGLGLQITSPDINCGRGSYNDDAAPAVSTRVMVGIRVSLPLLLRLMLSCTSVIV
jgi:hypothetical protein